MARKRSAEAEAETQRAHEARLRYLSRNHEFRRDVDSLIRLRDALPPEQGKLTPERLKALQPFVATLEQVGKKWGVPWNLLSLVSSEGWHNASPPEERVSAASFLFDKPVIAWNDAPLPLLALVGIAEPEQTPADTRYLNLRVDLDYPVDTLVPMIEQEVRRFAKHRPRGRRRPDKVDFYLQVFDLAEQAETFPAIAKALTAPPSTVKSAFLAARRNIFGTMTAAASSKKELPLADFRRDEHVQTCPTCRSAERFEDMCSRTRAYAFQDHESQREQTGLDTVAQDISEDSATAERVDRLDELLDS